MRELRLDIRIADRIGAGLYLPNLFLCHISLIVDRGVKPTVRTPFAVEALKAARITAPMTIFCCVDDFDSAARAAHTVAPFCEFRCPSARAAHHCAGGAFLLRWQLLHNQLAKRKKIISEQVKDYGSAESVALQIAGKISDIEKLHSDSDSYREKFLKLYAECLNVVQYPSKRLKD